MSTSRNWLIYLFVVTALGWIASGYLFLRTYALGAGRLSRAVSEVTAPFCTSCEEILTSESAWQFGIPLAGWGLVYFVVLGFLVAFGSRGATRVALFVAAVGTGMSVVLTAAMLAGDSPVCSLCLLVHAINVSLFCLMAVVVSRQSAPDIEQPRFLWSNKPRWAAVAIAMVAGGSLQAALFRPANDITRRMVAAFNASPKIEIPIGADEPMLGQVDAPVRIVVFSSFQCPACATFAQTTHRLSEQFGNKLGIVFKDFPLGKDCNPKLIREMQPRACAAAYAAEAAHRQNGFWRYHDGIFSSSLRESDDDLMQIARLSGVDIQRWDADRRSPDVQMKVKADAALGGVLGVDGTPSVFLNGRRVRNISYGALRILIAREIKANFPQQSPARINR